MNDQWRRREESTASSSSMTDSDVSSSVASSRTASSVSQVGGQYSNASSRSVSNASSRSASTASRSVSNASSASRSVSNASAASTASRSVTNASPAAGVPRSTTASTQGSQRSVDFQRSSTNGSLQSGRMSRDMSRVDSHTAEMAAKQYGGMAAIPSFYGIRTRSSSSWSVLPEAEHKAGIEMTLKEPPLRFTLYGKSWAHDLIALPGNALRAELKDLYNMMWLCMRRGSYLSATDVTEFYSWFHEFAMFLEVWLQSEDVVFFPWVTATDGDIPDSLNGQQRNEEFAEIMTLAVKIEESNVLFSLRAPEVCLMAIANVVDAMTNRIVRYLATKEKFLPDILLEVYQDDQKLSIEKRTAAFLNGITAFPHGLAFITRGFKHPGEVTNWANKLLGDKEQVPFKSSRKWLTTVHMQRVGLQNEKLKLFGDMKLSDSTDSDPTRAEVVGTGNTGSRINSFYSASAAMSVVGSNQNSYANSAQASRQLSQVNSRQQSNVSQQSLGLNDGDMVAYLAAEGAVLASGSRGGSRQASNVSQGNGAVIREPSNAGSRGPSNVSQGSRQPSNVSNASGQGMTPIIVPASKGSSTQGSRQPSNASAANRQPSNASNRSYASVASSGSKASRQTSNASSVGRPTPAPMASGYGAGRSLATAPRPQAPPNQQAAPRVGISAMTTNDRLMSNSSVSTTTSRTASSVSDYSVSDLY